MTRELPDWSLIKEIIRRVEADPCGAMHRADLAAVFGLPPYGECMKQAIGIAWRNRKIDCCRDYVVRVPR